MSTTKNLDENKRFARRHFEEVWNDGAVERLDETYDGDWIGYGFAEEAIDLNGLKGFVAAYLEAFPDLRFTIEDQIAEADEVLTRFTMTGTHDGELMGIDPTGAEFSVTGMAVLQVEDGTCGASWVNMDVFGLMQQLGVVPE